MKDAEDEAFDELAKRQGDWGGGYQAKRKMAADKQEPWNEDEWRRNNWRCSHGWLRGEQCEICNAAQPAQEPVAWTTMPEAEDWCFVSGNKDPNVKLEGKWFPLYTTPQQRPWVGLTDAEIEELFQSAAGADEETDIRFARLIEAKLKEKNT